MSNTFTCCICGKECTGWGNNPLGAGWITKEGKIELPDFPDDARCCDECNCNYVIPGRLYRMKSNKNNSEQIVSD